MEKTYSGVGSRNTPAPILGFMQSLSWYLSTKGYTLRSGGACGADTAFEKGVNNDNKEIYLPWSRFNGNNSFRFNVTKQAIEIAKNYHPAWHKLKPGAVNLMGRNSFILLGENLDKPSDFVVCWTPDGKVIGGTGQMIRMAGDYGVFVFNLANDEQYGYLSKCIHENLFPYVGENRFSLIRENGKVV